MSDCATVASVLTDQRPGDGEDSPHKSAPLLPDGVNMVGNHHGQETLPSLSPIQIQQEYFENLPDCDWVK